MKNKKIEFTAKVWNRFKPEIQEQLCKKYEITLTNHYTKREKVTKILNSIDITSPQGAKNFESAMKKLDSGFQKLDSGLAKFDKAMAKMDENLGGIKINI